MRVLMDLYIIKELQELQALKESVSRDKKERNLKDYSSILQESLDTVRYVKFPKAEPPQLRTHPLEPILSVSQHTWFVISLHKEILLTSLQLLCQCAEIESDEEWCISKLKSTLCIIEIYNNQVAMATKGVATSKLCCSFTDICDLVVQTRGCVLCNRIMDTRPLLSHLINEWAGSHINLMKAIIALILGATTLLENSPHDQKYIYAKTWQECSQLVSGKWNELAMCLDGRVWQEVSRQVVPQLRVLIDNEKEREILYETMKGLDKNYITVHKCLQYIFNVLEMDNTIHKAFTGVSCQLPLLAAPTRKPSSSTTSTVLDSIFPHIKTGIFLLLNQKSSIKKKETTIKTVADETDTLKLSYPLLDLIHSSLWSVSHWLTQSLQENIAAGKLVAVVSLLLIEGPLLMEKGQEIVKECGMIGVSHLCTPSYSSQYWVTLWSKLKYSDLYQCSKWTDNQLRHLCQLFFNQWREKCCELLSNVFPSPSNWKKQRVSADIKPSNYVTILQQQLVEPLLEACRTLQSPQIQQCLIHLCLSSFLYEWRSLLIGGQYKVNPQIANQLRLDYNHLISHFTNDSSGLHPSTQRMVTSFGACRDMTAGLKLLCGEGECEISEEKSYLDETLLKLIGQVEIVTEVAWLDNNEWKKCL